MPKYYFVATAATASRTITSRPCATVDDALRGAQFMLGSGASSVWIIDGEGDLVLTADQVRSRLVRSYPSATGSAAE